MGWFEVGAARWIFSFQYAFGKNASYPICLFFMVCLVHSSTLVPSRNAVNWWTAGGRHCTGYGRGDGGLAGYAGSADILVV